MNIVKYIILSIFVLAISVSSYAQNSGASSGNGILTTHWNNLKQADRFFREKNYKKAVRMYKNISKKKKTIAVNLRMGQCYFFLKKHKKSIQTYQNILDTITSIDPRHYLYFAQALTQTKAYDKAQIYFNKYAEHTENQIIESKFDSSSFYQRQKDYTVQRIESLNSDKSDFAPIFYQNKIIFVSSRDRFKPFQHLDNTTGNSVFKLYSAEILSEDTTQKEYKIGSVEEFDRRLSAHVNQGSAVFYDNDTKMVFTQNHIKKNNRSNQGMLHLGLFFAQKDQNGHWSNIQPFQHNSTEYSLAHPAISQDGKTLYFASNMPNGHGETDIYVSYLKNDNEWTSPKNIGKPVNTARKEVFPFLFEQKGRKPKLYFSSDGHGGLGGLEIMYARLLDYGWSYPENMGYPISTHHNDFAFTIHKSGKKGLFTSDRNGGKGDDDIYAVTITELPETSRFFRVSGVVREHLITGKLKPLKDVRIKLINQSTKSEVETKIADSLGRFFFQIAFETPYLIRAVKPGYDTATFHIDAQQELYANNMVDYKLKNATHISLNIFSADPILDVLDSAYVIPTNQRYPNHDTLAGNALGEIKVDTFHIQGKINLKHQPDQKYKIPITFYDSMENISHQIMTNEHGEFNLPLQQGNTYILHTDWRKNDTIFSTHCIKLVAQQKSDLGKNVSKIEFSVIPLVSGIKYASIPTNYTEENTLTKITQESLDEIVTFMKLNPTVKIHIQAHTSSRGEATDNRLRSTIKALNVKDYLTSKGISNMRLSTTGYGESILLNDCVDEEPCSDEQHQINERIEIVITEFRPTPVASFDPANCLHCPRKMIK